MSLTQPDPWMLDAFEAAQTEFNSHLKDGEKFDFSQYKSIEEVYNVTDEIQRRQAKSGTLRNLARIQPYFDGLTQYAGVIEQFVQVKPDLLALIWVCDTDFQFVEPETDFCRVH